MAKKIFRYSDKKVAGMVVNPYIEGNITEAYPFLEKLVPDDTFGTNLDKLFRYMAWVYDPQSPMLADFSALQMRKEAALQEVGLAEEFTRGYNHIIIPFVKEVCNDMLFAEYIVNEHLFWDYSKSLTSSVEGDNTEDKLKAVERQGKMASMLSVFRAKRDDLRSAMFAGDKELERMDEELSAEKIAQDMLPRR